MPFLTDIRKTSPENDTIQVNDDTIGYKYHNITKYYENDILFVSQNEKSLDLIHPDLLDHIEGLIIYFDANNVNIYFSFSYEFPVNAFARFSFIFFLTFFQRDFLNSLKKYATFMQTNSIEFGILLCKELFDNSADGITYKEAKTYSNILDVIELERDSGDSDDGAASSHHDPVGYEELLQAIRAIIWSNVDLKRGKVSTQKTDSGGSKASTATTDNATAAAAKSSKKEEEDENPKFEAELDGFEQLLTEVMMFKETTSSWSRSERLAYAEKFACKFLQ